MVAPTGPDRAKGWRDWFKELWTNPQIEFVGGLRFYTVLAFVVLVGLRPRCYRPDQPEQVDDGAAMIGGGTSRGSPDDAKPGEAHDAGQGAKQPDNESHGTPPADPPDEAKEGEEPNTRAAATTSSSSHETKGAEQKAADVGTAKGQRQ